MALSSKKYLDPTKILENLVNSVGEKISYGEQKDLFEINIEIVERLSECLIHTKKYFSKSLKRKSSLKQPKSKESETL